MGVVNGMARDSSYIGGTQLEAFTTSGGLGTMCETLHGRVANIDYKTIRYPGHIELMNFFFHELLMRERRELAAEILTNAKPPVDDDVVYVHVAAEGYVKGRLRRSEFVRFLPAEDGRRNDEHGDRVDHRRVGRCRDRNGAQRHTAQQWIAEAGRHSARSVPRDHNWPPVR